MTRAFLAVEPPEDVLAAVAERVQGVALDGGRPTPREQWHLTVQFLGDAVDVDAVGAAFAREPLTVGPGTVALGGARALGRARHAQVLVLGLCAGEDWMRGLASEVGRRLAPLGYPPEARAFVPHLTIARFRHPTDVRPYRDAIGDDPVGPPWTVTEIVLFESRLRAQGAQHEERGRIAVGA